MEIRSDLTTNGKDLPTPILGITNALQKNDSDKQNS